MTPKAKARPWNKLIQLNKITTFALRDTTKRMERHTGNWEEASSNHTSSKGLAPKIYEGYLRLYEVKVKAAQSCPTLCDSMDYTVHGILQVRILEWAAFPFSRGSSRPRDQTQVSHIADGFFTS